MKHSFHPLVLLCCLCLSLLCHGADAIKLPAPALKNCASLADALKQRKSDRTFSPDALTSQQLSDILWCAYGSNRPGDKRTIAAAMGKYTISIYVLTKDGAFFHDRAGNTLTCVSKVDLRNFAEGRGTLGHSAGAVFLLVADDNVFKSMPAANANLLIGYEAGSICQNIYLYCAAYELNALCCGSLDAKALTSALKLSGGKRPLLTMIVGAGK